MEIHQTVLKRVTRDDVARIRRWLGDEEVSGSWFGRYSYGDPAHLGYDPIKMETASNEEWERVFEDPEHSILSIYTPQQVHIGEIHVAIEASLGDGHLSVLIGRKDLWHQGYGKASVSKSLQLSFVNWGLFRIWVDIPVYNTSAIDMFKHLGFVHEGTLRKSRPHEGARFDSVVMGILASEYETG